MDQAVQGSGPGPAIVRTIVTEHGGAVTVRSASGRGSTFRITLPVAAGAATEPVPAEAAAEPVPAEAAAEPVPAEAAAEPVPAPVPVPEPARGS